MYRLLWTDTWLSDEIKKLTPGTYALDIETTGLDPFENEVLLIQVMKDTWDNVLIINAREVPNHVIIDYLQALNKIAEIIILHNAKFDIKFLMHKYGWVPKRGVIYDTQIAEFVMYNGLVQKYTSLKNLIKKYLGKDIDKEIRLSFIDFPEDGEFTEELLEYAADDAALLFDICSSQQYYLVKNNLMRVIEIENELVTAVAKMELAGVAMDIPKWLDLYKENVDKAEEISKTLSEMAKGITHAEFYSKRYDKTNEYDFSDGSYNPNSSQQTVALLNARGNDIKSSGEEILIYLDDEFAKILLEYRKYKKRASTYGLNIIEMLNPYTGRLHATFNQLGPASGRFASMGPNMQNVPAEKKYRHCFISPDGRVLITADYSQIELRLAGEMAHEEKFILAYNNDEDVHQLTASIIGRSRQDGKTFNFMIMYGAEAYKASITFGIPREEAEQLVMNWRDGLESLSNFLEETKEHLRTYGWVETMSGRRRYFDLPDTSTKQGWVKMNKYYREACNHPIQGTSADMTKIAITNLFYRLQEYDAYPILTVHDEITVECNEKDGEMIQKIVLEEMIKAGAVFLKEIPVKAESQLGKVWDH